MLYPNQQHFFKKLAFFKFFLVLGLTAFCTLHAQVKIGDNAIDISAFSVLELESSDKGFLIVRMDSAQRDAVFNQSSPVGMMIFNTDTQRVEVYQYEEDLVTGKRAPIKSWGSLRTKGINTLRSETPAAGDIYFDLLDNTMYAWNPNESRWVPFGASSSASNTTSGIALDNPILRGASDPTLEDLQTAAGLHALGQLYLNTNTGYLYMVDDRNKDGQVDSWTRITGRGSDNLGNHTLTENINLKTFSFIDSFGSGGSPNQLLTRTATGTQWRDPTPSFTTTNGLNLNSGVLKLGGPLTEATQILTSASNTLAITGLESLTYSPTINLVSVDQTNGVLQRINASNIVQEEVVKHVAANDQIQFQTPLAINSVSKINVYRNGVLIDFTQAGVNIIEVEAQAKCYSGDEIKIIQFQ